MNEIEGVKRKICAIADHLLLLYSNYDDESASRLVKNWLAKYIPPHIMTEVLIESMDSNTIAQGVDGIAFVDCGRRFVAEVMSKELKDQESECEDERDEIQTHRTDWVYKR